MKKVEIKNFILSLLFFVFFNSCKTSIIKYEGKSDIAFKEYLKVSKIEYYELNDSIYSKYYSKYLKDELKQKFDRNQYLKTNQVYVHYRTNNSVEFSVYSDEGVFCLNTFDLDMNGKILSFPQNGVVKVLYPITVEFFGDFELTDNILKSRKRSKTPFNEWYDYVNGTIKNDTIHFTEKYVGTNSHKFKKRWLAKTRKTDIQEVYQPNLKAEKHVDKYGLIYFTVTGEFEFIQQKDNDEEKMFMLMDKIKY